MRIWEISLEVKVGLLIVTHKRHVLGEEEIVKRDVSVNDVVVVQVYHSFHQLCKQFTGWRYRSWETTMRNKKLN
jgi:hypothetical protein